MAALYSLEDNQGWNPDLVQLLRDNAIRVLQESHTAAQFWSYILSYEQQVIIDSGYDPRALPNYSKHVDFLNSVTEAVEGYRDVLDEFSPHKRFFEGSKDSYEDLKKVLIVGFIALVGVQFIK